MKDELGTDVTTERIAELEQHFMFRSDFAARDVGLILRAQQAEIERLLGLLARTSSYLDYMEERGYSSVRIIRSEVAQTLRGAGYEEKASYWTRPAESQT